ncbi:MAG: hypothetical protein VKO39_07445 [Cyanobacteriota bacterium]|nr:hypothetical protein [Cyanobacteriota bacterium]
MLAARERVDLRQSVDSWRLDWLRAGLEAIVLAAALAPGETLVTALPADRSIVAWLGPLPRQSANA